MFKKLFRIVEDIEYLLRYEPVRGVSRAALIAAYLRFVGKLLLREVFGIAFRTERFFGLTVGFFDYRDFIALWREIFLKQIYFFEPKHDQPYILDGGSNIGMSALYFKFLFPQARIVCFEPDQEGYRQLVENLKINGFSDVATHRCALSDTDGETVYFAGTTGGGIGNTIKENAYRDDKPERQQVPTRRLSPFMNEKVDFLKLDIEGSEYEVFTDIAENMHQIDAALIEVHLFDRGNERVADVIGPLEQSGMRVTVTSFNRKNFLSFFSEEAHQDAFLLAARR